MSKQLQPAGFHPIRRDQRLLETVMDSYKTKGKLPEPTVCPDCGAVFHAGRWQWLAKPKDAHQTSCPACHRVRDHFPAGYVSLAGEFFAAHEQEILHLMQHREAQEKAEHPLQRIMAIEKTEHGTVVTTSTIMEVAGDYSRAQLQTYSNRLTERFGTVAASGGIVPQFLRNFIAGTLLESKWFTRHVVLDRWFLHTRQASLHAAEIVGTMRLTH